MSVQGFANIVYNFLPYIAHEIPLAEVEEPPGKKRSKIPMQMRFKTYKFLSANTLSITSLMSHGTTTLLKPEKAMHTTARASRFDTVK